MSAATASINTDERLGLKVAFPVAAAAILFAGTIGAVNSAGRAVPASDAAGLRVMGRVEEDADNSAGSNGAINAILKRGIFRFPNSATNAVDADDIGKYCYVEDDSTVAETSTHKVKAGLVLGVDEVGVWVDTMYADRVPSADTITGAADLAALKVALLALLEAQGIVK